MRHRMIQTQGYLTVALARNGRLYLQNGLTAKFQPLAPAPRPLTNFAIAPAGLVGSAKTSTSPATWILPINIQTGRPGNQWQPLQVPRCREMTGNGVMWAGIGENNKVYTGCFNMQNPTQVKMLNPIEKPSKVALTNFGIFVASGNITYWAASSGGMGNFGPWQKCKP